MTPAHESAVAVWHLTAWREGKPPNRRLLIRVDYTTEVARRQRIREHHEGVGAAAASLRRFLSALAAW